MESIPATGKTAHISLLKSVRGFTRDVAALLGSLLAIPAGEKVIYVHTGSAGLHLLALLTIAAFVGVSTSVLALHPSILARLAWGP